MSEQQYSEDFPQEWNNLSTSTNMGSIFDTSEENSLLSTDTSTSKSNSSVRSSSSDHSSQPSMNPAMVHQSTQAGKGNVVPKPRKSVTKKDKSPNSSVISSQGSQNLNQLNLSETTLMGEYTSITPPNLSSESGFEKDLHQVQKVFSEATSIDTSIDSGNVVKVMLPDGTTTSNGRIVINVKVNMSQPTTEEPKVLEVHNTTLLPSEAPSQQVVKAPRKRIRSTNASKENKENAILIEKTEGKPKKQTEKKEPAKKATKATQKAIDVQEPDLNPHKCTECGKTTKPRKPRAKKSISSETN